MSRRSAVLCAAVVALLGPLVVDTAPQAHAGPALSGTVATGAATFADCSSAACRSFFTADCPAAMAVAEGATASIIDVSQAAGQRLTFTWSNAVADAASPLGSPAAPGPGAELYFYLVDSCQKPRFISFALTTLSGQRSQSVNVSKHAAWLIAEPTPIAGAVAWSAG